MNIKIAFYNLIIINTITYLYLKIIIINKFH